MRRTLVAGWVILAVGGLLILAAQAAPHDAALQTASLGAPAPAATSAAPQSAVLLMAAGAGAGIVGLALVALSLRSSKE